MRRTIARVGRELWLRGFGPGAAVMFVALASCFVLVSYQGEGFPRKPPGTSTRWQLHGGKLMVQVNDVPAGFQRPLPPMWLGETRAGPNTDSVKPGVIIWMTNPIEHGLRFADYFRIFFYSWFVQFNLIYIAAILLVLPMIRACLRRRPPGVCKKFGYDLRGTPADSPCPECGTRDNAARGAIAAGG